MTKKGQVTLEGGVSNAMMLGVLIIVVSIIAGVLTGLQTSYLADNGSGVFNVPTYASNITGDGLVAFDNLSGQFGNLGTVIAAAIILTVLIVGLGFIVFRNQY